MSTITNFKNFVVKTNPNPPTPQKAKKYDFDRETFNNSLMIYEDKYHQTLSAVADTIRRVSFNEFIVALGQCVNQLPKGLLTHSVILVSEHKSNKWVAEIARRYFTEKFSLKPVFLELGHEDANEYVKTLDSIQPKKWPTEIVLFDDATFSGNQMSRHVTAIANKMASKKVGGNIYVVEPYATNVALKALNSIKLPGNIKLHIYNASIVPTVKEVLSSEDFDSLNEVCGGVLIKEEEGDEQKDSGIATTYFDHKIPNNQSFIFSVIARDFMPDVKPPYIN